MVVADDRGQPVVLERGGEAGAEDRVALDLLELAGRQPSRFLQDFGRDDDLADVVDVSGALDPEDLLVVQADAPGEDAALHCDPAGVAGRAGDAGLEGGDKSSQPRVPGRAWSGDARGSSPHLDRIWAVERLQHRQMCPSPAVQRGDTHRGTIEFRT